LPLLAAMVRMASAGGMLPEQVWDAAPIPGRGLAPGRPTGGAMPLAWTHAEYIKLLISRSLKRPFDRPESVWQRYRGERPALRRVIWCEHAPASELPQGCSLTLALREPGTFRWGLDGWQDVREQATSAHPLGLHLLDIDSARLAAGRSIDVTFRRAASEWVGRDFRIAVTARGASRG
jgi:glucoamylase